MAKFNADIKAAVKRREVIRFTYEGESRTVEPHCHGRNNSTGNELLRAWQTGKGGGWKLFKVSEIKSMTKNGKVFNFARKDYNPDDEAMDEYFARI